jgi:hypothetical protein
VRFLLGFLLAAVAATSCGGERGESAEAGRPVSRADVRNSWRPGCPVPIGQLRLLAVRYWGLDGREHRGRLVVHEDVADDVSAVFRRLLDAHFPIARMQLVDRYGGDDGRSMTANNTSAFNCRLVAGTGRWSEHAYGRAVDINPVQNPQVTSGGEVVPARGRRYADRSLAVPGMIHAGDEVVAAFESIGWRWGGNFSSTKDYQHFSATGR